MTPCDAGIIGVCTGVSCHAHHVKRRSQGGTRTIQVCWRCHGHIHQNPSWARSWGFLVRSWEDENSAAPVHGADPATVGPYPQ